MSKSRANLSFSRASVVGLIGTAPVGGPAMPLAGLEENVGV